MPVYNLAGARVCVRVTEKLPAGDVFALKGVPAARDHHGVAKELLGDRASEIVGRLLVGAGRRRGRVRLGALLRLVLLLLPHNLRRSMRG